MPRSPIYFGEGLDRESGLMVMERTRFQDLRNVLLHEGKIQLRPGFLASGTGDFAEVDQLIAGEPLRSQALGIVVGYNSSTRRVYVYRVSPDLSLVELVGEWVHDLSSGWPAETPVVHLAEVYGRIFMAHDEPFVSRRAPTIYYDAISGGDLINNLTSSWAGSAGGGAESQESTESAESAESVIVQDAIRFRGVVRHLAYLVGWGFGTAAEPRPELVRISLPGEPTQFEQNHYFIAGDRNDAVLACGASASPGDRQGGILNVWKRAETHAIYGYDRRTFGIRLIDERYGIVASRAWTSVDGVAIAWSEEGPRVWTGLGASEQLETPLALDDWEPDDLVDETEAKYAYAFFVPRQRVAWFVFGQRVYALTARIPGRWRWSYHELGFPTYGAMLFFASTEGAFAPPGYPECGSTTAAGTYIDVGVVNHNQVGDEFIEVYVRPYVNVPAYENGVVQDGAGAKYLEGPNSSGLPSGFSAIGSNWFSSGTFGVTDTYDGVTPDDLEFSLSAQGASPSARVGLGWDAFDGFQYGEIVTLTRWPGSGYIVGPAWQMDGTGGFPQLSFVRIRVTSGTARLQWVDEQSGGSASFKGSEVDSGVAVSSGDWVWARARIDDAGGTSWRVRAKVWTGDFADEPGGWTIDVTASTNHYGDAFAMGWGTHIGPLSAVDVNFGFLAYSDDPDSTSVPGPEDVAGTLEPGDWYLAKTVPVSALTNQTIRIEDLEPGNLYDIALRYRRGLLYNAGASDTDNPDTWPSISQCQTTTTADPPTVNSATWSRIDGSTEQIEVDLTPADADEDIEIWRAVEIGGSPGTPVMIDTISAPHVGDVQYQDQTISGENAYYYYGVTAAAVDSPLSNGVRAWAGPAAIPVREYFFFGSNNYTVGFSTDDAALDTELWDNMVGAADPDFPDAGPMSLKVTASAGETEIERTTSFNEADDFEWNYKLRHALEQFSVTDYGEFGPTFVGDWPEGLTP